MDILNRFVKLLGVVLLLSLVSVLAGCVGAGGRYAGSDGAPSGDFDASKIPDAVPKPEAKSRYGNPAHYVAFGKHYHVLDSAKGYTKVGYASWYGTKFHGQNTSTDEPYNMYSMTAASPTLPIPCYVRVTNLENDRSVVVRVNDRGPFKSNRIIDLSYAAAKKLGYAGKGTTLVRVTAIDTDSKPTLFAENDKPSAVSSNTTTKTQSSPHYYQKHPSKHTTTLVAENNNKTSLYLQVGSFKTKSKAEKVSQQIKALTQESVAVRESYLNNKPVYRVHIGPLANNSQTDKIKQLLQRHGFEKTLAVAG